MKCIYILDQEAKTKRFRPSVCPSAKLLYTISHEQVKIFEFGDPNARRLTKLEPNEVFNDFSISRHQIDENDLGFYILKI